MKPKSPMHHRHFAGTTRTAVQILGLLTAIPLAHAEIIEFDLSPAGFDTATGLSAANEVPANVSTGTGNEISGGITFDTVTSTLSLAFGYGSAAGFTDLTGSTTGIAIQGPAAAGATAGALFDLASIHFPAADSTKGGVIFGSVVYTPEQAADLLEGRNYVNLSSIANTGGEIRGQLVPLINRAPEIICPESSVEECGESVTYTATVSDIDGDAVQVVWSLNGSPVQTDDIAAAGPPSTAPLEYTAVLPLGANSLTLTATDSAGNVSTCSSTITVEDTVPPVIESVSATPNVLWPPNHQMIPVLVSAEVYDACGPTTWKIIEITSSEPEDIIGSGNTAPDWAITGDSRANLRAERSGTNSEGRTYTLTVQAEDESGNLSEPATVEVKVPHSQAATKTKAKAR